MIAHRNHSANTMLAIDGPNRNAGIRIDHFLLNACAAEMLVAVDVETDER